MVTRRTLALSAAPALLAGLAACGSSTSAGTAGTPSVKDAALAFQTALINDDPTTACKYIDPAALKAQVAKAGPALAGKDCITLLTTVLNVAKSTGQPIQPAKDITVLSQAATTATVRVTAANGVAQTSTWALEDGTWKVTATGK